MLLSFLKKRLIFIILLLTFIVFLLTLGKTVLPNGDSGELITTAYFGGVAHPPGYPLYNLLGHLFLNLPLPGEVAYRLNLLSAIYSVIGLFFIYQSLLIMTSTNYFLSVFLTSAIAFSYSYWLYSITAEVFSLHVLILSILIFLLLKIYYCLTTKNLMILVFLWGLFFGLGLSNNHLIILIFPSFVSMFEWKLKETDFKKKQFSLFFLFCLALFLGLLPYSFFFWASRDVNPASWSYFYSLSDIIRHFLRVDYGSIGNYHDFGFSKLNISYVGTNVLSFIAACYSDFWIISFLFPFGMYWVFLHKRKLYFIFKILLASHLMLLVVLKYSITTFSFSILERIFLSLGVVLILLCGFFLSWISNFRQIKKYKTIFIFSLFFIVFFEGFINFKRVNQSKNQACKYYYLDLVRSVPEKSITFVVGDIESFCFIYYHYVSSISQKTRNKIFLLSNEFNRNNRGKFAQKAYDFSLGNAESVIDLAKNKTEIGFRVFSTDISTFPSDFFLPRGLLKEYVPKTKKISNQDLIAIYNFNKSFFDNSIFLNKYQEDYATLSTRTLKEMYCFKYLEMVNFFVKHQKKTYAAKIFNNLKLKCDKTYFVDQYHQKMYSNFIRKKLDSQ